MKLRSMAAWFAASAVAVSAMAVTASAAETNVIDFEDGEMVGFSMKTDDGGDQSVVSVVDFNGSKQLKVEIQDKKKVPKIYFDLDEIYGENLTKVASIQFDISIISKEDVDLDDVNDPIGWAGGAIGVQADGAKVAWGQQDWTLEDYGEYEDEETDDEDEDAEPIGGHIYSTMVRKNISIPEFCDDAHMLLMRWAASGDQPAYDIYIDNVAAFDADGNAVAAYVATAEDTTADEEETADEEDVAEEDDADEEVVADEEEAADEDEADEDDADEEVVADEEAADEDEADEDDADEDEADEDEADEEEAPVAEEEVKEEVTAPVVDEAPAAGDVDAATDSSKGSPDTGIADVAAVAGLAIVAGGVVLVSKKRK